MKNNKKGSVLIVVVGVLALLAMMAGAFVSTMTMQRAIGNNVKTGVHAELAAQKGFAHALAEIVTHSNNGGETTTNLTQSWYTTFAKNSATAANNCSDVLAIYEGDKSDDADDWPNPDPYPDTTGDNFDEKTIWYEYSVDDIKFVNNKKVTKTIDCRYTVMTLDLMGRMYINEVNKTTAPHHDAPVARIVDINSGSTGTLATINSAKSLMDIKRIYNTAGAGTLFDDPDYINRVTPYGATAADSLGSGHNPDICAININTAPKMIRYGIVNQIVKMTEDTLSGYSNTGTDVGPNPNGTDFSYPFAPAAVSHTNYSSDIAKSVLEALTIDYTSPATINSVENTLYTYLDSDVTVNTDILKVYNDDWNDSHATLLQPNDDGKKAKAMEIAVNDVLNSLFNDSNCTHDTTTDGLYKIDFDGSTVGKFDWTETAVGVIANIDSIYHSMSVVKATNSNVWPNKSGGSAANTTAGTSTSWGRTPELYVGKSKYFYIIVRGEAKKSTSTKWKSSKNLEAAIQIVGTSYKILYKRWFTR
jgi:hypothetical protein